MLKRFALLPLIMACCFAACKKRQNASIGSSPNATASPPVATATPVPTPQKPVIDQSAEVVVFGYHRFVNKVRRPDTEITPAAFEAQMQELKDKGIAVIGMQDFLAWKRGEKTIPPKCVVLTLDDGWKSQYQVAWPILKKYGYPLTLFIYTEGIRGGRFGGSEALSWEQLAEMRDAGVDIQAHSKTHQDLRRPYDKVRKQKLTPEEYEEWLRDEVAGSKAMLEQKLGIKVSSFAVPYGFINDHVREVIKQSGYDAVFTVYGQPLTFSTPLDSLGRYLIEANKPKVFADALQFGGSGETAPATAEVSALVLSVQPPEGATVNRRPLIKANLAGFGSIDAGTVQMRISGLGLVSAAFDAKTQNISYQVPQPLRDKSCTVIIEAKSGGKKVSTHWNFGLDDSAAPPVSGSPPKGP